jgi:hypothetical protein
MIEPTDRNMRTSVIPQVIWVVVLPKVSARPDTVSETVKKSKASQVCYLLAYGQDIDMFILTQAINPTKKKSHCLPLSIASRVKGFGALFIGGLRVVIRVAAYWPAVILGG